MLLILFFILASVGYTAWRIWMILPVSPIWKGILTGLHIFCFLLIFIHFALERWTPVPLSAATYILGTSWLIFFLYALLIFVLLDLGSLLHILPSGFLKNSPAGTCTVLGVIAVLLTYGGIHYHHKYREEIEITAAQPLEKPLTIVLASDLHVGYHNRRAGLERWIRLINAEHPDLVLLAGDILDGAIRPAEHWRYDEAFRQLEAPVYASLGNHEYITGIDTSLAFYDKAGIRLLRDSSVTAEGIRIIGRDDRTNRNRKPLNALTVNDFLFTILLDHQPYHLEEAEACGIDFQFSGHTHHGQIWPGNWVTDMMYEKAYGPHQRGATRYYITSGLGIWGGKFRIGTRSEYVVLKITPSEP